MNAKTLVSITTNASGQPSRVLPLSEIVTLCREGAHRPLVAKIREVYASTFSKTSDIKKAKDAVAADKRNLPGIMFSGVFRARGDKNLETYSQHLCGDVDNLSAERVGIVFAQLEKDPHCSMVSFSPTYSGVKVICPTTGTAEQHKQNVAAMMKYFRDTYQIEIDPSCINIERLCFAPDNASDWNFAALPFDPLPVEPKTERAKIQAAPLNHHSNRAEIAERLLGSIQWTDEGGFCKCPGEHLHTTANGAKDCKVMLDGVPTVKCFHNSCSGIVDGVNHELRSRIGKAEFVPPDSNRAGIASEYLPSAAEAQTAPQTPESKSLGDLKRRTADDPNELLRTGYLCRAGGLLLAAPTGIGKSSFGIQAQIMFSLGRPMFGITPTRPLRSLYIQAENDDGDLAEMRDGVIAGFDLTPGELETVYANVITAQENTRTGPAFFNNTVAPLLELHHPDLLWIDPALSYIGGEASSQKDVGSFLRNLLNPLLSRFNCGCVVIHHTNKPSRGEEKSAWQAGDFAYLGSGSAEWANWARAVLAIRSIGSHNVFELRVGKRGSRIGWKDGEGNPAFTRLIGHATEPGVICWRAASEDETPAGKPRRAGKPEDLTALVPLEKPIAKALLIEQWKDRYGNKDKGRAFLDGLVADGKLFEWRLTRPGTNAAKLICRKPQI